MATLIGLIAAFWIRFKSGWIGFGVKLPNPPEIEDYAGLMAVGATFLMLLLFTQNLYDPRHLLRLRRVVMLVTKSVLMWFALYLSLSLAAKLDPPISRIYAASSAVLCWGAILGWRTAFHTFIQSPTIAQRLRQRLIFVGWNSEASKLAQSITGDPSHPYALLGCLPSVDGKYAETPPPSIPRLGDYTDLPDILARQAADMVVATDLDATTNEVISLANLCERQFVQFKVVPSYFQILVSGLQLETISGVPVLGVSRLPLDRLYNRTLKRGVDLVGSVVGLVLFAPIIAYCAWRIRREDPGPVFFAQERIGRMGRPFRMWKLRSMYQGSEKQDHLNQSTLRDDPRVLPIGRLMRRLNFDEAPQFWNVLRGEMSLVGPRPERTFHSTKLSEQIPHYNARYTTKPGITGWAQIHGLRGDTDLVERVAYDIFYLENWSLLLDGQIMVATFMTRKNAY
ncbi:MAG: exopolysaccharide biosynthesis polyprenyl glycosylphosphotransferase [Verrucomicrobiales bacterium]|nr:exopolysaccharide biosynthesis polyprenyl glycosylphosphotransferase [Verrucomicrobiales bacterium]